MLYMLYWVYWLYFINKNGTFIILYKRYLNVYTIFIKKFYSYHKYFFSFIYVLYMLYNTMLPISMYKQIDQYKQFTKKESGDASPVRWINLLLIKLLQKLKCNKNFNFNKKFLYLDFSSNLPIYILKNYYI